MPAASPLAASKFPQSNFRFHCADLLEHEVPEAPGFDTVLVFQCAPHLSDADMRRMLHRSVTLLRSGGELVIFDLVRPWPGESFNKRFYFKLDRVEHVRNEMELLALFDRNDAFGQPEAEVLTAHKLGIDVMDLILIRARRQAVSEKA